MIVKVADAIISPLGSSTEANYEAVKAGRSMLREYQWDSLPEPFVASLMDWHGIDMREGMSRFEMMAIGVVEQLFPQLSIDLSSPRVLFIISTTKGNVELLEEDNDSPSSSVYLGDTAMKIVRHFGNPNTPVVVSNACISGLCAQITAVRALESGCYDYAVVVGADIQSRFIISGFQSFKALSPAPCKPFDDERQGLNLGEAAAAIVFQRVEQVMPGQWLCRKSAIRNDANHISGPSRTGEGSYRALRTVLTDVPVDDLAFVNVHGTSTLYNDEMESIAIDRAGLSDVPVNSLKGYYGHTMGAAGILEVILSMRAIEDHTVLATRGFDHLGVSRQIKVSNQHRTTTKNSFIKLLSGFGGCNAAMAFTRVTEDCPSFPCLEGSAPSHDHPSLSTLSEIMLTPQKATLNGKELNTTQQGGALLTELYRQYINDYPKFFKMDELTKLGFVASELLLKIGDKMPQGTEEVAVILFNRTSSLCNDRKYQSTISKLEDFYPSPSLFVYTLPNIVTGEIAIRNHYFGETSFYVLDHEDPKLMREIIMSVLEEGEARVVLYGWVDCEDADHYLAKMACVKKHVSRS